MPHNSFVRGGVGSGNWTNYVVAHGAMEQLDQYAFQSINGDLGGTWTPAAIISIGGLGMEIANSHFDVRAASQARLLTGSFLTVDGTSGITGQSGALLTWIGTADFSGPVTFLGAITVALTASSLLTVDATSTISSVAGSQLVWHGTAQFFGTVSVTGASFQTGGTTSVTFQKDVTFSSSTDLVQFAGPVEFDGNVSRLGKSNASARIFQLTNNGNHTIGVASGTIFTNGADELHQFGTGASATTIKVTSTGARDGNQMLISWWETVNALTLVNDSNVTICQLKSGAGGANQSRAAPPAGFYNWVRLYFLSGGWNIGDGQSA